MPLYTNGRRINTYFSKDGMRYIRPVPEAAYNFYIELTVFAEKNVHNPLPVFIKQKSGASIRPNKENSSEAFYINYEDKSKVLKSFDTIESAFKNEYGLQQLLNDRVSQGVDYDNDNIYNLAKKLIHAAINNENTPLQPTQIISIPDIRNISLSENDYRCAIGTLKCAVELLLFKSHLYNAGYLATTCPKRDLIFIFVANAQVSNNSHSAGLDVEPLKFRSFGEENEDVIGLALSSKAISLYDTKRKVSSNLNVSTLFLENFFV
ncbi:hypothetical protein [Bartonella phoceensis]|uniref:hypothetical protein n=1 Tax=Bartonella phoceensis TaxID=270249 RepID=UPI001FE7173E|nr:hypothetical protein [Bartonella phoceensis]